MVLRKLASYFWNFRNEIVTVVISGIGLYYRFETFAGRKLWNDEVYQFQFMKGAFKPIWLRNYYGDFSSFPGDYVIAYPFVQLFGLNKWGLAIPHILMTILGFYFLYLAGKRYFKTTVGFIVAFVVASFNETLIFHAFEFRPYGVLTTLAIGAFYIIDRFIFDYATWGKNRKFLVGIYLAAITCFHALGILFIVLSVLYSFLLYPRDKESLGVLKEITKYFAGIFVILSFIWLWYVKLGPFHEEREILVSARPVFEYISNPLDNPTSFLKSIFGNLVGKKAFYFLLTGCILSLCISYRDRLKQWIFFFIFIIVGIELILHIALLKQYWFLQRQFIWAMPLFAFFLGWQWDSLTDALTHKTLGIKRREK